MRLFILLLAFSFAASTPVSTSAQDSGGRDTTWTYGGSLGLDLSGLAILNPRVGGGTGRVGLGGLGSVSANHKGQKSFWNNQVSLQLSVQKLGRTSLSQPEGFQKNLDVLRLTSTYGYKIGGDKWYVSADLLAQSQLLETYKSNYLKPVVLDGKQDIVVSKFLSPALVQFSPGVTFKPNGHMTFQYSPVAVRFIYVADDSLALLDIHGNEVTRDANGVITDYKNHFLGLGSELVGRYENKYYNDRLSVNSTLRLFSNYLDSPSAIDVLFTNNFSIQLFKGLSLDLLGELFYDQDVKMNLDSNDNGVYGDSGDKQAPAAQLTGAFLLKYSKIF
ncbi:MAG: DUF3078 domain-containing protein [Bacteroidetes bacterium]|nr:MAG: DUF3078 domain-containing protein [Bacteroidota bacterium]